MDEVLGSNLGTAKKERKKKKTLYQYLSWVPCDPYGYIRLKFVTKK
jgi:hypothetical protein